MFMFFISDTMQFFFLSHFYGLPFHVLGFLFCGGVGWAGEDWHCFFVCLFISFVLFSYLSARPFYKSVEFGVIFEKKFKT